MFIKLYSGFLSPIDLRPKSKITKKDIENRVENKLKSLGFKINGSNFARFSCNTISELNVIFKELSKLGLNAGEVGWT